MTARADDTGDAGDAGDLARVTRATGTDSPDPPRLSRRGFWITLAAAIAVFLIVDDPVGGDAFAIDRSIAWSYLPIPLGVVGFLALERALSARAVVAETTLLVIAKFGITASIAVVLWVRAGAPVDRAVAPAGPGGEIVRVPVDHRGAPGVRGTGDRNGPAADAPVLSPRVVEAAPDDGSASGGGAWHAPATDRATDRAPVGSGESVSAGVGRAVRVPVGAWAVIDGGDAQLHTALAIADNGRVLFNRPLVPGSSPWPIRLDRPGRVDLRCAVHPHERYPTVIVTP